MANTEDRTAALIRSCLRQNFRIFIDTCSLLSPEADLFWSRVTPVLTEGKKAFIVPYRVWEEVEKFANDPKCGERKNDPSLQQRAQRALKHLQVQRKAGRIEVFGDQHDNFADNVFLTVFTQFRLKYNLMLITQDRRLSGDILMISKSRAVNSNFRILVEHIDKNGMLCETREEAFENAAQFHRSGGTAQESRKTGGGNGAGNGAGAAALKKNGSAAQNKSGAQDIKTGQGAKPAAKSAKQMAGSAPKPQSDGTEVERFLLPSQVAHVTGGLTATVIPEEGAAVMAVKNDGRWMTRLVKKISAGGEGTVYTTSEAHVVAKIYKKEKIDRAKYEKLRLMISKRINCPGICFPTALLFNEKNEFVGYLMPEAKGEVLKNTVFGRRSMFESLFPGWTKKEMAALSVTILKKMKYLHDRNVIMGDINGNNILIVSPTEVYFVDTDSYQIEGFPCPVGTPEFTPPEFQGRSYAEHLRTLGNENFAVATLLFELMVPGKSPYAHKGGGNVVENIRNGDFAYPSGERSTGKAPEGPWPYCWSHLPRFLKDDFYETFHKDGAHSTEKTRYSSAEWLKKFQRYQQLLGNGSIEKYDEESLKIFPTRYKKAYGAEYIKCRLCGKDTDAKQAKEGICQDCLKKGEPYRCKGCGSELLYTNYQKYVKRAAPYPYCKDCNEKRKQIAETKTCKLCGRKFRLTYEEKWYYEGMGYQLPGKCPACRGRVSYSAAGGGNGPQKRSGCFITTAVCDYLHKPDDCYELSMLRAFRDGWLCNAPDGEALIREYYRIAPEMIKAIDASDARGAVYPKLWTDYILPCVRLIEQKDYEACRKLYADMVMKLKERFLKED